METFRTIRKIFLTLSAIGGVGGFIIWALVEGPRHIPHNYIEFVFVAIIVIAQFIVFVIFFKIILMIIEAVKKDAKNIKVFSDKQYLEAYSEVEENNIQNKELWAKAFAQCGGDKEKQKSIYVELRTKELFKGLLMEKVKANNRYNHKDKHYLGHANRQVKELFESSKVHLAS